MVDCNPLTPALWFVLDLSYKLFPNYYTAVGKISTDTSHCVDSRASCCDCYIVCSVYLTGFVFKASTVFTVFIIYQEWYCVDSCIYNVELCKKLIYTISDCPGKSATLCCDSTCVLHCELTIAGMWYVTDEQWLQQVNDSLSSQLFSWF